MSSDSMAANLSPNSAQEADSGAEMTFKRKPRFTTLRGVRREMGALYLDLLNGRVPQKIAGTAGNILSGIAKALEAETLEARLRELEDRAGIVAREKPQRWVGHA
jgi:hypothetical protein